MYFQIWNMNTIQIISWEPQYWQCLPDYSEHESLNIGNVYLTTVSMKASILAMFTWLQWAWEPQYWQCLPDYSEHKSLNTGNVYLTTVSMRASILAMLTWLQWAWEPQYWQCLGVHMAAPACSPEYSSWWRSHSLWTWCSGRSPSPTHTNTNTVSWHPDTSNVMVFFLNNIADVKQRSWVVILLAATA